MRFVVDASLVVKRLVFELSADMEEKQATGGHDPFALRLKASEVANAP